MPIFRHAHPDRFTVLPNALLRDERLSLRDLGLLCYMLSLPQDWDFSMHGMHAVLMHDGENSIRAGVRNLEQAGYLRRIKKRQANGSICQHEWQITDIPDRFQDSDPALQPLDENPLVENPLVENPLVENPLVANPLVDNPTQTKKLLNKETNNKETIISHNNDFTSSIPDVQQVLMFCREEGLAVDADTFVNYYAARGWELRPGLPMRDWRAAARLWAKKAQQTAQPEFYTGGNEWANRL